MAVEHNTNALLTFVVGPYRLGVPAIQVDAIINMPAFRSVPLTPPSVAGVFAHRNQIACIISLRRKFGLPELVDQTAGQLILGHINAGLTAFWVDKVLDMESITANGIRPLPALNHQRAFDPFAFKEDEIYLRTDFEALYALEDTDVTSDTLPVPNDSAPHQVTESPPVSDSNGVRLSTRTSSVNGHLTESDQASPEKPIKSIQRSGATSSAPMTARRQVHSVKSKVGKQTVKTGPKRQFNAVTPRRQHRQATRQAAKHRQLHQPPLSRITAPTVSRSPKSVTPDRRYRKVILLIALAIALIGASTFMLWPEEKAILSPAASADQAPIRPALQSNHQAAIIIDAPLPDKEKLPNVVIAVPKTVPASTLEPFGRGATPVPSTPLPTPLIPTVADRAVWRIETDDFILTVERPNPEAHTTVRLQPQPSEGISEKVHVVVPGDTLWHIAQRYLGDPFRYPELAALSRIKNPDLIYPDDIVRIKIKRGPDN